MSFVDHQSKRLLDLSTASANLRPGQSLNNTSAYLNAANAANSRPVSAIYGAQAAASINAYKVYPGSQKILRPQTAFSGQTSCKI